MRALLLCLFGVGCAGTTVAPAPKVAASAYYPLEPGNVWVYRANYLGQEQQRTVVMGPEQDGFHVDDAGARLMYDGQGLRDERRYLLHEPLQAGQTWRSVAAVGATESYTIMKVHTPCSTRVQRFEDCIEVKSTIDAPGGRLENTMVFARDTGLVHLETVLAIGDKRTRQVDMELVQFKRAQ